MTEGKVTVVARIRAKAGKEELVREHLLALIGPTRAEAGCINYDLHQSAEEKGLFLFYENWVSRKALDEHLATPHLEGFKAVADEILAEPLDITLWKLIS
ncbi:MAG: putative quinol monooxygenase [Chloroflexota bacterium]